MPGHGAKHRDGLGPHGHDGEEALPPYPLIGKDGVLLHLDPSRFVKQAPALDENKKRRHTDELAACSPHRLATAARPTQGTQRGLLDEKGRGR